MGAIPLSTAPTPHPRLSARSAAKFLRLPAVEQMRLLHDQKYPDQTPQKFRINYYGIAKAGIKDYLTNGAMGLIDTRAKIAREKIASRRMHLNRVVASFIDSEHAKRGLLPQVIPRYHAHMRNLELRLSPDLVALEGQEERFIYFNTTAEEMPTEVARLTLEIAFWILQENGAKVEAKQVEFIDLFNGKLYRGKKVRASTIKTLEENARLIESMWPTIEP